MKLTRNKLIETLRRKNEGWTTYQARKIAGISIRRVNQVWGLYQQTGKPPDIGRRNGRPAKTVDIMEGLSKKPAATMCLKKKEVESGSYAAQLEAYYKRLKKQIAKAVI